MNATVFVEKVGKKKFRATTVQPVLMEAEGASQDEALERLHALAKKRLAEGALFQMSLSDVPSGNPWQAFAGIWQDHPDFDAFRGNIEAYRRSKNRSRS
jgi:hypothetical protein